MKKYKTWEVIKMLTENNKLKFRTVDNYTLANNGYGLLQAYSNAGKQIDWSGNIQLKDEWTLVQQPVSFMEVLKSTKAIRVEDEFINTLEANECDKEFLDDLLRGEFKTLDDLLYYLSFYADEKELRDILLNGKWYIEED
jgi:hypothetical protein